MKSMVCEMCNSSDFIRQDGMLICRSCDIKYSISEAERIMVKRSADIQGTVKVGNNAFTQNRLAKARRKKRKED